MIFFHIYYINSYRYKREMLKVICLICQMEKEIFEHSFEKAFRVARET